MQFSAHAVLPSMRHPMVTRHSDVTDHAPRKHDVHQGHDVTGHVPPPQPLPATQHH